MRLLLDTHIYLWAVTGNRKLTRGARELIEQADEVFVSAASLWEAAIKIGLGRLDADIDALAAEISRSGFVELPVKVPHAAMVRKLPEIHRDPFDRMLVSQAIVEPLRLVTSDESLVRYTDLVLLV